MVVSEVAANISHKYVIIKNWTPFTDCMSKMSNTKVDNAKEIDVVMPMYSLIEQLITIRKHLEVYGNTTEINQI